MTAFEAGIRLSPRQRGPFGLLLQRLISAGFDRSLLSQQADELVEMMMLACPQEPDQWAMAAELTEWVRWLRAPAYCLTYIFQLLTLKQRSGCHSSAALLFADAQVAIAEDEAMMSVEVAWRSLTSLVTANPGMGPGLEPAVRHVIARLRDMHGYYARFSRPVDYHFADPLHDTLYTQRVYVDLRAEYRQQTEGVAAAESAADRARAYQSLIAELGAGGDTYHWLVARRLAGMERQYAGDLAGAESEIASLLPDARQAGLEAEIGHLLRIHAWQLTVLGQLQPAARELEAALKHEQPVSMFGYWYALTARQLGDVRMRTALLTPEGLADEDGRKATLGSALEAYRPGRRLLDVCLNSPGPPAGAVSKRQMLRTYTGNALQIALAQGRSADALAEIEATGPRAVGTALAETRALAQLTDASAQEFLASRQVFQRYLTSIPQSFDQYLAALPVEFEQRRRYHQAREGMRVMARRNSDEIAERLLARRGDDRLILAFFIDSIPLSRAVLLDLADGTVKDCVVKNSDDDLRQAHRQYVSALESAAAMPGYPPLGARAALDAFLAAVQNALQECLDMLAERADGRPLVVVPQMQLHDVPFGALALGGDSVLDVVSSISTVPSLGVLADLLEAQDSIRPTAANLTALHDTTGTPFFAGTLRHLAQRRHLSVLANPDPAAALSALLGGGHGDVLLACHGAFSNDDPAASSLQLGAGGTLSLSDVWEGVALSQARCVVLGACESGLARAQVGSEYSGLAGALLSAGARSILGSLWEVNQLATAVLLDDCLGRLATGTDVPAALAAAQRALRVTSRDDLAAWIAAYLPEFQRTLGAAISAMPQRPFSHPDDWAGFFVAGL